MSIEQKVSMITEGIFNRPVGRGEGGETDVAPGAKKFRLLES